MHRLLVSPDLLTEDTPSLPREASNHLRVLRPREGESVELFDGAGHVRTYACRSGRLAADGVVRFFERPSGSLTLFACITKGSRWDWTIEKATELGVTRLVPVISERTIVRLKDDERAAKRERYRRIAEDAARQSDAKWLPEVAVPMDFADSLNLVRQTTCFVGALTAPPPRALAAAVADARASGGGPDWSVYVGPEGDFSPAELTALLEIAMPTSFGPNVLRAETAAIYALAVLSAGLYD